MADGLHSRCGLEPLGTRLQKRNMSSTGTQAGADRRTAHLGQNGHQLQSCREPGNQLPPPSVTVCQPAPSAWHVEGALARWAERRVRAGSWGPGGAVLLRGSD